MRKKYNFRQPLGKDLNGLYITAAQMQFFLNRRNGERYFIEGDSKFFEHFYKCAVYNIVWDMLEEDPGCATLFWDETQETVGIKFPIDGKVMKELKRKKLQTYFEEDEL
jgi:hypothetical protein|tara:strand:+ start:8219 stop:8545 length:327 start_codon:yes stop_codon:yes gene_type:complete